MYQLGDRFNKYGRIKLNITKDQLIVLIGNDYKESLLGRGTRIEIENAKFWISEDGKIYQIGVEGDFKGKYKGIIGIGSTLSDVKKLLVIMFKYMIHMKWKMKGESASN